MHETCGQVFGAHASFHTLAREAEKERETLLISSLNFHVVTKHLYVDVLLIRICFRAVTVTGCKAGIIIEQK